MNIEGLSKAKVLAALYNRAQPLGMGFLHYDPAEMTEEQAQEILNSSPVILGGFYFDYLKGRVMKVDLRTDEVRTQLYNRDNGENAAEDAVDAIR